MNDVMELTLSQLEDLTKGIIGDETSNSPSASSKKVISGSDAITFLKQGNGKL